MQYSELKEKAREAQYKAQSGTLTSSPLNAQDYHTAEELAHCLEEVADRQDGEQVVDIDELQDDITEVADSATPVYNGELAEWFGDNWTAYDDIAEELGRENMGEDIMQGIGIAYYLTLERAMREVLQEYINKNECKRCAGDINEGHTCVPTVGGNA